MFIATAIKFNVKLGGAKCYKVEVRLRSIFRSSGAWNSILRVIYKRLVPPGPKARANSSKNRKLEIAKPAKHPEKLLNRDILRRSSLLN